MTHAVLHIRKTWRRPGLMWCGVWVIDGDTIEKGAPECANCRWAIDLHARMRR